jgi:hypothetical protein
MYNNNMNKITITGPKQAIQAGEWANKNIKGEWNLELIDPFSNRYHFKFVEPEDATFFALRWKQ